MMSSKIISRRVYQSAKHLLALITDVIDISKIEAGRIDTFPTTFYLARPD